MLEEYQKILILGFGLEGRATFDYLKKKGITADVADILSPEEFFKLHSDLEQDSWNYFGGEKYLKKVFDYDLVFRTPGISPLTSELVQAKKQRIEVTSQIRFFMDWCQGKTIGITGTKGKGTTSSLIYEILKKDGRKVFLGGNIGAPAISFLDDLDQDSIAVLELSSFQLMDLHKSPNIAVVLNVTQDHLDYHFDREEYVEAKKTIVKFQRPEDSAVVNFDYGTSRLFSELTSGKVLEIRTLGKEVQCGCFVDKKNEIILKDETLREEIVNLSQLQLRGRHNLENVCPAVAASFLAGASLGTIKELVRSFKGLEHRLEFVAEVDGVKYYNDSFSTTPETTMAALDSFEEPIILIAGGSEKGSNYQEMGQKIARKAKTVFLIGDMAEKINYSIPENSKVKILTGFSNMYQLIREASQEAVRGDVVLLSPGCASFGLFANYKERGSLFKKAVFGLKNSSE